MSIAVKSEQDSVAALKKLIAGQGHISGTYYAVAKKELKKAGIIITLANKDPNGAKAMSIGKAIKKELNVNPFSRGLVSYDPTTKKLSFAASKGNITPKNLRATLMKHLSDDKLKKMVKGSLEK